jgi:hypothetical protein
MKHFGLVISFILVLVDSLGCATSNLFTHPVDLKLDPPAAAKNGTAKASAEQAEPKSAKAFGAHEKVETSVDLDFFTLVNELPTKTNSGTVNATAYIPSAILQPKKVVVLVPGSGISSREGEAKTDSIHTYDEMIKINVAWGEALANAGVYVLAYDKRTCVEKKNSICRTNDQTDIDALGIKALANDLDQVCAFVDLNVGTGSEFQLILWGTAQAAQVIASSECHKRASAVVLVAPVITSLKKTWVDGFLLASEQTTSRIRKNDLKNQSQKFDDFFLNLEKGNFPVGGFVQGASVSFWQSWLSASGQTLGSLTAAGNPTLILYSEGDPFMGPSIMSDLHKATPKGLVVAQSVKNADRNLLSSGALSPQAVPAVLEFINKKARPAQKSPVEAAAQPIVNQ